MAASSVTPEPIFIGPGLSPFKKVATVIGVIVLIALVLAIAIHEGLSAVGSTIVAVLFILGFVYYLRLVAPVPFTIQLGKEKLIKKSRRNEVVEVRWEDLTRVKEEFFHNGKRIGVTVYRKVTEPGQKPKAWAVYRDDVTDIDGLAQALKQAIPDSCQWQSETVHD
ncbi:MAG TPA: hypothetical protein VHZ51_00470 [Ktedonobacteraceae bacterium]|nr:hypothetical protein [Ktedonobacteraceae bacterium]